MADFNELCQRFPALAGDLARAYLGGSSVPIKTDIDPAHDPDALDDPSTYTLDELWLLWQDEEEHATLYTDLAAYFREDAEWDRDCRRMP